MTVQVIDESKQEFRGVVYYKCGNYYQRKGVRLHRIVYETFHGLIPRGMQVHHIDGDRNNNRPENLTILTAHDHISGHMKEPGRIENAYKAIEIARKYASEWHKSKAGREFHSSLAKQVWSERSPIEYECTQCGKKFTTLKCFKESTNKFCSNNCRSQHRRESKIDNVSRVCACCGKEFMTNKYSQQKTCGRTCSVKMRWGK